MFRIIAVCLSLLPLLVCEAVFTALGWGRPGEVEDPYVGFDELRPLFVRRGDEYHISESRLEFFRPTSFAAKKPQGTFRIFCLGGSTVQGRPYATETSFTTWLELNLQAADASRDWEVVNCGGVSYASYRLVPIMREVLQHGSPDLVVVYTGHNEFLEDRAYKSVKETPSALATAHNLLSGVRTYCVVRSAFVSDAVPQRTSLSAEVDALLDYRGGLEDYHRDDAWRRGTVEHFEFNLRRMVALAREAGVPVLLVNPACDLKDTPPFKLEHSGDLTDDQKQQFAAVWEQAQAQQGKDLEQQRDLLEQAVAIDDRHAGVHFYLGKTYEALGQFDKAKQSLIRARDQDICPLRIIQPMHDAIERVADETGAPLVDARGLFERNSPHGIPGKELLIDHVHPHISGHQLIADALLEALADQQVVKPATDWRQRREPLFATHLQSLDHVYYERGKQRLAGLKRWAEGRAIKMRTSE